MFSTVNVNTEFKKSSPSLDYLPKWKHCLHYFSYDPVFGEVTGTLLEQCNLSSTLLGL